MGVVGSRLTAELFVRKGFTVKYVGDFYTPNDAKIDVTLSGCGYDVPDAYIISYPLVDDLREVKRQIKGCDVVIAHKSMEIFSKACYDLGIPFMPNFITFFLPDSVRFWEVEIPTIDYDTLTYTVTCALQVNETVKLLKGEEVTIAPKAIIVDLKDDLIRVINLKMLR
ncbi:hypothetical protein [Archaeoglobus sp.]